MCHSLLQFALTCDIGLETWHGEGVLFSSSKYQCRAQLNMLHFRHVPSTLVAKQLFCVSILTEYNSRLLGSSRKGSTQECLMRWLQSWPQMQQGSWDSRSCLLLKVGSPLCPLSDDMEQSPKDCPITTYKKAISSCSIYAEQKLNVASKFQRPECQMP